MQKENIIDFSRYRDLRNEIAKDRSPSISEELSNAIESLIHRLRELGPLKQT